MIKKSCKSRRFQLRYIFPIAGVTLLALYAISLFVPIAWALLTSLKSRVDFIKNPFGFPAEYHFENYALAFRKLYVEVYNGMESHKVFLGRLMLNSVVYAVTSTIMLTLTPCITAYACSRFPFKLAKVIYMVAVITLFLPIIGNLPSELNMMRKLNLYDSLLGLVVLKGHFTGLYFFVFFAVFKSLPRDFEEAAKMDGAGNFRIFLTINIPMVKTTIFAVALLYFVACWNEYTTPMLFLPGFPTVAYGLYKFQFSTDQVISSVPMQMTACVLVILPVFVVFMFLKNYLMGNVAMGGIKG